MTCEPPGFLARTRSATGFNHADNSLGTTIITLHKQHGHSGSLPQENPRIPYVFLQSRRGMGHIPGILGNLCICKICIIKCNQAGPAVSREQMWFSFSTQHLLHSSLENTD